MISRWLGEFIGELIAAFKSALVCGDTASMLSQTRYGPHFEVTGSRKNILESFPAGQVLNRQINNLPADAAERQDK